MSRPQTKGVCRLCGQTFAKTGMARHLESCLAKREADLRPGAGNPAYHLQVRDAYPGDYWMNVLIAGDAHLGYLDGFLRHMWLECCGHLSQFTILGKYYVVHEPEIDGDYMDQTLVQDALKSGLTFEYEYDFGSTTELRLRVVGVHGMRKPPKKPEVLARNEPPETLCGTCGKPAVWICGQCYDEEGVLCRACAKTHRCGDEMLLPIINSPRTGVCGYDGPDPEAPKHDRRRD